MRSARFRRFLVIGYLLLSGCTPEAIDKRPVLEIGLNDIQITVVGSKVTGTNNTASWDYVDKHLRHKYTVGRTRIVFVDRTLFIQNRCYGHMGFNSRVFIDDDTGVVEMKGKRNLGQPLTSEEASWLAAPGISNVTYDAQP